MRVNKQFILTKIDKPAQKAHQEKKGNIFLSPKFLYMKFNLQYGDIVQIGDKAQTFFPMIAVGDTIIFRHTVEQEDWRVVDKQFNANFPGDYSMRDEFRVVDATDDYSVLGFIKSDGTWLASDAYVYVNKKVELVAREHITSLFIGGNAEMWQDDELIFRKIEEMKLDQQNMKDTMASVTDYKRLEEIYGQLERTAKDMERLTKLLHAKKLCKSTIELISSHTSRELGAKTGQQVLLSDFAMLYNLRIKAREYMLMLKDEVIGVYN